MIRLLLFLVLAAFSSSIYSQNTPELLSQSDWWPAPGITGPQVDLFQLEYDWKWGPEPAEAYRISWVIGANYQAEDQKISLAPEDLLMHPPAIRRAYLKADIYLDNDYVDTWRWSTEQVPASGKGWSTWQKQPSNLAQLTKELPDSLKPMLSLRYLQVVELDFDGLEAFEEITGLRTKSAELALARLSEWENSWQENQAAAQARRAVARPTPHMNAAQADEVLRLSYAVDEISHRAWLSRLSQFATDQQDLDLLSLCLSYDPALPVASSERGPLLWQAIAQGNDSLTALMVEKARFIPNEAIGGNQVLPELVRRQMHHACAAWVNGRGADLAIADAQGNTALHWAVIQKDTFLTRLLTDAGAQVDVPDAQGRTVLFLAIENGFFNQTSYLAGVAQDLTVANLKGQRALHEAVVQRNLSAMQALLDAGFPVDLTGESGMTALHYAAERGYFPETQLLLAAGAQKNLTDYFGRTAFGIAKDRKDRPLASILR
jgi:ankyrin repeat protein